MSDEQEFLDAVERFGQQILQEHPELGRVLEKARNGEIEAREAVKEVWGLAARNAALHGTLESALFDAFRIDPASTDLARFPDREKMLERWGFEEEDLIYTPFEDRPNYKMLHPLLMGMIVELIQFDGDVPELRTGRLPEGGAPAVPVRTTSRDPVVIGAMLRTASEEVAGELAEAQTEHDAKVAKMIDAIGGSGAEVTGLVRQETERGVGVPGYVPGRRAEMRDVEAPARHELARLSYQDRQALAHKTLTSTQGRRSAAPVIEKMLLDLLHADGYTGVRSGEGETVFVEANWSMTIDGGRRERNPRFNFIDVAARSIGAKLKRDIAGRASRFTRLFLRVAPVNEVAERRVGWRATISE